MTSVLFNHQLSANIVGAYNLLNELRAFLVSQGWTQVTYLTDVRWQFVNPGYAFVAQAAGTGEDFLEMTAPGQGAQNQSLRFRFRLYRDNSADDHEWLQISAFKVGETGYDTASSIHPVNRHSGSAAGWPVYQFHSLPRNATISKVWFFAVDYFFAMFMQWSPTRCGHIMLGSLKLNNPDDAEGDFLGVSYFSTSSSQRWYNGNQASALDNLDEQILWDGVSADIGVMRHGLNFSTTQNNGSGINYGEILDKVPTSFVRRPQQQSNLLIRTNSSGTRWQNVGGFPINRIQHNGYSIGQKVLYGLEEYLVFPQIRLEYTGAGYAVRIL